MGYLRLTDPLCRLNMRTYSGAQKYSHKKQGEANGDEYGRMTADETPPIRHTRYVYDRRLWLVLTCAALTVATVAANMSATNREEVLTVWADGDGEAVTTTAPTTSVQASATSVAVPPPTTTTSAPRQLVATTTTALVTTTTLPPTTTTTTATVPAWDGNSPLEPGTEVSGGGGWGASRTVTQGRTRLVWEIYPRDLYGPETLEATAEIHDEGVVTEVHVDFGDGTSWDATAPMYSCAKTNPYPRPNPIYYGAPSHTYAQPGDYPVKVTVTTWSCEDFAKTYEMKDKNVVSATITVHVHAESCRPNHIRYGCPG